MADPIDRKAAIDVVRKWFALIGLNGDICIDGIASLPSAESEIKDRLDSAYAHGYTEAEAHFYKVLQSRPEIIRCKDCKYKYVDGDNAKFNLCALNHNRVQSDDWYCADAEREENEDKG